MKVPFLRPRWSRQNRLKYLRAVAMKSWEDALYWNGGKLEGVDPVLVLGREKIKSIAPGPRLMIMSRRTAWIFPRYVRWQHRVDRLIRLPRWLPAWAKRRLYDRAMKKGMATVNPMPGMDCR